MPDPRPGEGREEFLDRCIPMLIDEGREPDQAVAVCISMYEDRIKPFDVEQDLKQRYWKAFDMKRESFQRKFARRVYRAIQEQIEPYREAKTLQDFNVPLNPDPMTEALVELYVEVGQSFAVDSYIGLKAQKGIQVKQEQVPEFIQRMTRYIRDSRRIGLINGTTERELKRILTLALEEGLTIDDTIQLIIQQFGDLSVARAETIARTEIASASNLGSLEGALSTQVAFDKEWLSMMDDRMREFAKEDEWDHRRMNGQQVGKYEKFRMQSATGLVDELLCPADPEGHVGNVINCRCTQIYRTLED